ncbi:MAG: hypothetical protein AAF658_14785, partial [Myxococcota bacterium]
MLMRFLVFLLALGASTAAYAQNQSAPESGCYLLQSRTIGESIRAQGGITRFYQLDDEASTQDAGDYGFYLRRADPRDPFFLLKDGRGDYLRASNAMASGDSMPNDDSLLRVQPAGNGAWTLTAKASGRRLRARVDIFVGHRIDFSTITDEATEFLLVPAEGCRNPWVEDEPALGTTAAALVSDPNEPIVGLADVHNHIFSNVGFNGDLISGYGHHPLGALVALDDCGEEHGSLGLGDLVGGFQRGDFDGHATRGFPDAAHPAHNDFNHQQSYYRWLERAHRGGLRLIVMLGTSNTGACVLNRSSPDLDCDDMAAIDRQLDAAYELVEYVDMYNGGPGRGWFQIADSPSEARQLIAEGKMAVVLGIETAELFGCIAGKGCTETDVEEALDIYRDRGVRY